MREGFSTESPRGPFVRAALYLVHVAVWLTAALFAVWAAAALLFDVPEASGWVAGAFVFLVVAGTLLVRRRRWAVLVPLAASGAILMWWLRLEPSLTRDWQADVSRLPWAEIAGDTVTIHDVRDFDYPGNAAEIPRWTTRTVRLDDIEGVDLALNYWGSPWVAHPIIIFRVRGAEPLAFSIETRKERGEEYSALAGFFRRYELIVLAGTERDLLGVRAVRREGEDVYLFATTVTPGAARERFLEYARTMNDLRSRARWYNAVTTNCTTSIRNMHEGAKMPFDWRLLVNGKGDEMLYEMGLLETGGLAMDELKRRSWANADVRSAYAGENFSAEIRRSRSLR